MTSENPASSVKEVGGTGISGSSLFAAKGAYCKILPMRFSGAGCACGHVLACAAPAEAGLLQGSTLVSLKGDCSSNCSPGWLLSRLLLLHQPLHLAFHPHQGRAGLSPTSRQASGVGSRKGPMAWSRGWSFQRPGTKQELLLPLSLVLRWGCSYACQTACLSWPWVWVLTAG